MISITISKLYPPKGNIMGMAILEGKQKATGRAD